MKLKLFFKILFLLTVCFVNGQTPIALKFEFKQRKIAIFPQEYKDYFVEKTFTPTKQEIIKAELSLINKIKEINAQKPNQIESPIIDKNLKKYNRQYFGVIDENGKKYLFINFIWSKDCKTDNWLNQYFSIFDGGSFYWNIKYDIDNDKFFDFNVNGNS